MNKIRTTLFVIAALAATASAQTLTQRIDFSRGSQPYTTTFWLDKSGWELDWFGNNASQNWDIELSHSILTTSHLTVCAGAVSWPASRKYFGLLTAFYTDKLAGADLFLMVGGYLPLNGGPQILLSDDSALMWPSGKDTKLGVGTTFFLEGGAAQLRLGPQLEYTLRGTTLRLSYQPFHLVGKGPVVTRIELSTRF